jgi:anaerobic magnesium-protoporphyrin IX monomethyl ester cyclase
LGKVQERERYPRERGEDTTKVLLSTPPGRTTELWPPLGILYIASSLKAARSDEVVVVDAFCENLDADRLVERIKAERPDVLGLNCSTHTFLEAISVLKRASEALPEATIVLGGYHATFAAELILKEYRFVDYIIKGEAERALIQLLDCLDMSGDPAQVDGISFLRGEKVVSNPITLIQDLDALPFPDRSLLRNVQYGYTLQGIKLTFGKFTTVSTSRGCPFKCTYCSCAAFSLRKWRPRSADSVADELENLHDQGYESCVIVDDNFTHNLKRTEAICELIRNRRIRMKFYCEGRVDSATLPLMRTMKKAGFDVIYFGAESASPHVLDWYNKHIKPEKTKAAIANAKKAGMLVITSYIIGAPVETRADIERTIGFIKETRPHGVQINILDCLVGTTIWDDLLAQNIPGPDDWKTNHRVYEYNRDGLGREDLEPLVNAAYEAYLKGWWRKESIPELLRVLALNTTAKRVILSNLFNPSARRRLGEGMRAYPGAGAAESADKKGNEE